MVALAPEARLRAVTPPRMLTVAIRPAVVSSGLLAGALVAVLLADLTLQGNPTGYIAFHQATTVLYTATLPPLGAVMAISIIVSLVKGRGVPGIGWLLITALACGVVGMLVTVLVHFPLNATIMTWRVGVVPADFVSVASRWVAAHLVRTVITVIAFVLGMIALEMVTRAKPRSASTTRAHSN